MGFDPIPGYGMVPWGRSHTNTSAKSYDILYSTSDKLSLFK